MNFRLGIAISVCLFLVAVMMLIPSDATVCGNSLGVTASDSRYEKEYALVTITITEITKIENDPNSYYVEYDIDDIYYLEGAKSNIFEKSGFFLTRYTEWIDEVKQIGNTIYHKTDTLETEKKFVIVYGKYQEKWQPYITCRGIYGEGLIEYMKWIKENETPFDYSEYKTFSNIHKPSLQNVDRFGKVFIGNLTGIEQTDEGKKYFVFEKVYELYNLYQEDEIKYKILPNFYKFDYYQDEPKINDLYFLHLNNVAVWLEINETREQFNAAPNAIVPIEDSYSYLEDFYSDINQKRIVYFKNIQDFNQDVKNNSILKENLRTSHSIEYYYEIEDYPKIYVKIKNINNEILDEWKKLISSYGFEVDDFDYNLYTEIHSSKKSDEITARDYFVPSVAEQLSWNVHPFDIDCGFNNLVILNDGNPQCVSSKKTKLMLENDEIVLQAKPKVMLNFDSLYRLI